jgi:hydrogenase maturation protease
MTDHVLILGLGNELLADDAAGLLAIRRLRSLIGDRAGVDLVESSEHGLALLDVLAGHDRAVILDAIRTGRHPPGEIFRLDVASIAPAPATSPHYAGIPEILALARALGLRSPAEVTVLAMEVTDTRTLGGPIAPVVRRAIPRLCEAAIERLDHPG